MSKKRKKKRNDLPVVVSAVVCFVLAAVCCCVLLFAPSEETAENNPDVTGTESVSSSSESLSGNSDSSRTDSEINDAEIEQNSPESVPASDTTTDPEESSQPELESSSGENSEAQPSSESHSEVESTSETESQSESSDVTTSVPVQEGDFVDYTVSFDDIHRGYLILVNNETPYVFPKDEYGSFVNVYDEKSKGYKMRDDDIFMEGRAMHAMDDMLVAFYKKTQIRDVIVNSCYRTLASQENILKKRIASDGEEKAYQYVAIPGCSEHHTGLAVDFGLYTSDGDSHTFTGEGEYSYIYETCADYGMILRYTEEKKQYTLIAAESWHFRYVDVPHSEIITEKGFCLEEYIDYLRSFTADGNHLCYTRKDGSTYEIYFVPANENTVSIPVPKNGTFTMSGNNVDGFIVTWNTTGQGR